MVVVAVVVVAVLVAVVVVVVVVVVVTKDTGCATLPSNRTYGPDSLTT